MDYVGSRFLGFCLSDLGIDDKNFALMAKKACGKKGKLVGFTTLTPDYVEKILWMSL